jgi:hypothetical protein
MIMRGDRNRPEFRARCGSLAHDLVRREPEMGRITAKETLDVWWAGNLLKPLFLKGLEETLADMRARRNRVQR